MQKKRKLRSQAGQQALRELSWEGLAARRRTPSLGDGDNLDQQIGKTGSGRAAEVAEEHPQARLLMTQPGVVSDHFTGFCLDHRRCCALPSRQAGGQLSGTDSVRAQLGRTQPAATTKQANCFVRMLLVEAAEQ